MLFSENTNFYYKLDKAHFFLNAFISPDILIEKERREYLEFKLKNDLG